MSAYNVMKNKTLKKFIGRVGVENIEELFELQIADSKGHRKDADYTPILKRREEVRKILAQGEPISVNQLKINGDDLMKLGFRPGKEIGVLLKELLDLVLEKPELNTKEDLMQIVKNKKSFY
jgi:tRNA nucleotidyltransferase (CCA-adding enzyme)